MSNYNEDFFKLENNFKSIDHILSIPIINSNIAFVPKITIAIPTFKRHGLLKVALDSAINQSSNFEYDIIVVDNDPSRDCDTEKLLLKYQVSYLSYYKNSENLGMVGNWNRLYSLSKGEYVVMLHDDDFLFPSFVDVLSKFLKKNDDYHAIYLPYVISNHVNIDIFSENNKPIKYLESICYKDFLWENIIGPPVGMCLNRKSVINFGGFRNSHYPSIDYDFYVRFSRLFKSCKLIGESQAIYRIGQNESINKNTMLGFLESDFKIKNAILQTYSNKLFIFIWLRYFKEYTRNYLESKVALFGITEINTVYEIKNRGLESSFFNLVIYNLFNFYKRCKNKLIRSYYEAFNNNTCL